MNISLTFIRIFFTLLSILFLTTYTTAVGTGGFSFTNIVIGLASGLALGAILISIEFILKQFNFNLRSFNIALLGLFVGYLMGEAVLLTFNTILSLSQLPVSKEAAILFKTGVFLSTTYLGLILIARTADEIYVSVPFIKFKPSSPRKKDILIDWSILMDSRLIDIANSGLFDGQLIVPRFVLKELYLMLENSDEMIRNKARRCLDVFKKLENIPTLDLRYSNTDFDDIKDPASKLVQLARLLDSNIITADAPRFQQFVIEGVRIINIHLLSNTFKPLTGENICIKIQRYGKEPRQGVGYLDDGTMVVVNGGAEYIGESIKAQVLSVKHTTSGRMIFCNAADDLGILENSFGNSADNENEMDGTHKTYVTL